MHHFFHHHVVVVIVSLVAAGAVSVAIANHQAVPQTVGKLPNRVVVK